MVHNSKKTLILQKALEAVLGGGGNATSGGGVVVLPPALSIDIVSLLRWAIQAETSKVRGRLPPKIIVFINQAKNKKNFLSIFKSLACVWFWKCSVLNWVVTSHGDQFFF